VIRSLEGKGPQVHATAWVSEAAYVVGDIVIGERSSVWPSAVVRADEGRVTIGQWSNIQDGAVVHADYDAEIGDYVTVGHSAVVHSAKIGNYCLIGNNATVLDDVVLGDYCLVAAGAVVLPGVEAPANSLLVGAPAQVRPLDPKHLPLLESRGERYAQKAQRYKKEGL
jgi:carbonic anhydrase/acetyltransferase-like protein (isoleucine patch superfamily)